MFLPMLLVIFEADFSGWACINSTFSSFKKEGVMLKKKLTAAQEHPYRCFMDTPYYLNKVHNRGYGV